MFNWRVRRFFKWVNLIVCLSMLAQLLAGCATPVQPNASVAATPARPVQAVPPGQQKPVGSDQQPVFTPFPPNLPAQRSTASGLRPEPTKIPTAKAPTYTLPDGSLPPHPPGLASLPAPMQHAAFRVALNRTAGADTSMAPGWYLLSILDQPSDTRPAAVLASIAGNYSRVYAYDACDAADPWKIYDPANSSASDLTAIDQRLGFWVEMTGTATLHVAGIRPTNTTIQLCKGWNLIGYPQALALPVSNALAPIAGQYDRVFAWDPMNTDNPWDFEAMDAPNWANQLQTLHPGHGYWIHATQDTILNIAAPSLPPNMSIPGFIGSPANTDTISGQVPIVLAQGITLTGVTVDYWPVNDLNAAQVLVTDVDATGGETLATLDTTTLANGSYTIRVSGIDSNGNLVASGVMVTVEGGYKPGRVRFTITDLTVPVVGLPISIGRTYDSLEREQSGDFGYGWSLTIGNPKLEVNPAHDVTLTMPNGKRVTFYFKPRFIWGFGLTRYIPEAGVYGSLTANSCGLVVLSGGQYFCFPGSYYQESVSGYTYTDPYGRIYSMGTDGKLRSIQDLNDNTLTFSANGITSSAGGLQVAFGRDSEGHITQITDPMGNAYHYGYDAASNLVSVIVPSIITPTIYNYDSDHFFLGAVDARSNPTIVDTYYPDGRLKSETDALGNTYQYAYDLNTNTTTVVNPDGGTEISTYDTYGQLLSRTDPLSQTIAYVYDSNHNLLSQTQIGLPHSLTTSYTYDANGFQTSVTDPLHETNHIDHNQYGYLVNKVDQLGNTQHVDYDSKFRPTVVSDNVGRMGRFEWYGNGTLKTRADGNDHPISYTYDLYGNLASETDALQHQANYAYDTLGRLQTAIYPIGQTDYGYDPLGHIISITKKLDSTTRYTSKYRYDSNGNKTDEWDPRSTGPDSYHTHYDYDSLNRLGKTTYPDGTSVRNEYNWRGQVIAATDQAGHSTLYNYDLAGQLTKVTYASNTPDQSIVQYFYDEFGRAIKEVDGRGKSTSYEYDDAGRLTDIREPLNHHTSFTYYGNGLHQSSTDANHHTTTFVYDARYRLVQTIYHDNTIAAPDTSQRTYDLASNLKTVTDQAGETTTYDYDEANRLISVAHPLNATDTQATSYSYDAMNNLQTITDANQHTVRFDYDALGRQVKKTWPDLSFDLLGYDALGNLISRQVSDNPAHTNLMQYDALNRVQDVTYFDNQTIHYDYTPTGQRDRVILTDPQGGQDVTTYEYDSRDRLTRIAHANGQFTAYRYDENNNRLSLTTWPGTANDSVSYTYDDANQLTDIGNPVVGTTSYAYDAAGLRTHLLYPNGISVDYGYDPLNRPVNIQQHKGGQLLAAYDYTLGPTGNRLKVVEADGRSIQWSYDNAYRLTAEIDRNSSGTITDQTGFNYDAVGNRLKMTVNGSTTDYVYNALDQLVSAGAAQYQHDGRGNLTQVIQGTNVTAYAYNAADRLTGITKTGSMTLNASYQYDAEGRRVRQTLNGTLTNYLWDETTRNGDIVLETNESDTIQASYVRDIKGELLAQNRDGVLNYYLHDGQGSVRALADAAGNLTDRYAYDAFGNPQHLLGTNPNPYQYVGQQLDRLTGLYDLRARYYDPADGRFLSRDPAQPVLDNPSEINRYVYAANNPINASDPTGYQAFVEYSDLQEQDAEESGSIETLGEDVAGDPADTAEAELRLDDNNVSCDLASFSPNTLILTDHGERAINTLEVGDHVLGYDESSGEVGSYAVQAVLLHIDPIIERLTIDGEQLETTPQHLFYTQERGWVAAGDLKIGDHVRKTDGEYGVVQASVLLKQPQPMYNLSVAQAHSFFVGYSHWLVHNISCGPRKPINAKYAGRNFQIKDPAVQAKYPDGVNFNSEGYPDFSQYSEKTVHIRQIGDDYWDFKAANEAAGYTEGTPEGMVWHHVEDRSTMQLIPRELHEAVRHSGGVSMVKILGILFGPLMP